MDFTEEDKKILTVQRLGFLYFEPLEMEVKMRAYSIKFNGKGGHIDFVLQDKDGKEYEYFAKRNELEDWLKKFR